MTNPHVAKAVAASYLTELYKAAGWPVTPDMVEQLTDHTLANIRPDTDGYPVIKVVGRNRLQVEFNLDVKPAEFHGEQDGDGVVDAEIVDDLPSDVDGAPLPEPGDDAWREATPDAPEPKQWPAPTAAEGDVDEDNLPDPDDEEIAAGPEPTPKDAGGEYRSPWMDKGDEAVAKSATTA